VRWWPRAGRRQDDRSPGPEPAVRQEHVALAPPRRYDGVLPPQRGVGNQAAERLVPAAEGEPIAASERETLEMSFAEDLGGVRLHRDHDAATAADAKAFTIGRDIYFAPGAYSAGTLAHEIAHVIQQEHAAAAPVTTAEAALEREADAASAAVVAGRAADVSLAAAPMVQRQPAGGAPPAQGSAPLSRIRLLPTYSATIDGFEIDSPDLDGEQRRQLDALATRLKGTLASAPDSLVSIVGFADAPGTEHHNLALGRRRAEAVRDYVVGKGVAASALSVGSLGEELPAVASRGHEARNRRVEIDVTERSFFRATPPPLPVTPPVPAPPTGAIDLTYHPSVHMPTPEEEAREQARRNEEIWRIVQQLRAREQPQQGTSAADALGRIARGAARRLGLPEWLQDKAASLAEGLPSRGAQTVFDQLTADRNLDSTSRNAIKAILDALMRTPIR
jgi:outer membrane protein OmpA-like peptidoglycan-associated protein